MREDQSVAEMANEVLMRQAKARAERRGEPIEEAMEAVLDTEAGQQLMELRDGPHGEEGIEETQVDAARERAKSGQKSSADVWARPLGTPRTVDGTNFLELCKAEVQLRRIPLLRTRVNKGKGV
jgi:hypothetical protein